MAIDNSLFTDLYKLLVFLSGPIGAFTWMLFLSNAIRNLREEDTSRLDPASAELAVWVRNLRPLKLLVLSFLLSVGVPGLAALVIGLVPPELIARFQPVFAVIAMLLLMYIGQQIWYRTTRTSTNSGLITATTTGSKSTVTVSTDPKTDSMGR